MVDRGGDLGALLDFLASYAAYLPPHEFLIAIVVVGFLTLLGVGASSEQRDPALVQGDAHLIWGRGLVERRPAGWWGLLRRWRYSVRIEDHGLRLAPRHIGARGTWWTGDPAFDDVLAVSGPEASARGLLTAAVRAALVRLVRRNVTLDGGVLSVAARPWDRILPPLGLLSAGRALAKAATMPPATALRLIGRDDPAPGARTTAWLTLIGEHPAAPAVREQIHEALEEASPPMLRLFRSARNAASAWLALSLSDELPAEVRVAALTRGVDRARPGDARVAAAVFEALHASSLALRRAALLAATDPRHGEALVTLVRAELALEPPHAWIASDSEAVALTAQVLGRFGRPADTPALLALLPDAEGEALEAVCDALGKQGHLGAVAPLLARGAPDAVAAARRIQGRAGPSDVGAGALALAVSTGTVSLVEPGGLDLADAPPDVTARGE